ncbi:MAG TPA: hypothetical protein VMG14_01685 [Thermoplasmata archaeon]|nr:hypothetical protein [Thermoplasmata archaeon]
MRFYAFNASAYATVNGTEILNGTLTSLYVAIGDTVQCHTSANYTFVSWTSTWFALTDSASCSTTISALAASPGSYEVLSMTLDWSPPSANWAGYTTNATAMAVDVSGYFTIPQTQYVDYGSSEEVTEWLGYGGAEPWVNPDQVGDLTSGMDIWQAGVTEWYSSSDQFYIIPFYEVVYPGDMNGCAVNGRWYYVPTSDESPPYLGSYCSVPWTFPISPGDTIGVTLTLYDTPLGYYGNVTFIDLRTQQSWEMVSGQYLGTDDYPQTTVLDWIAEAPSPDGLGPLGNLPMPNLTSQITFYGENAMWQKSVEPINATYPLVQWEAEDQNDYSSVAYLCTQSMAPPADSPNGEFNVTYSTSPC